jgi:hypothetical protein
VLAVGGAVLYWRGLVADRADRVAVVPVLSGELVGLAAGGRF